MNSPKGGLDGGIRKVGFWVFAALFSFATWASNLLYDEVRGKQNDISTELKKVSETTARIDERLISQGQRLDRLEVVIENSKHRVR